MKILRPAHRYELANFDQPYNPGQIIQFIEKNPVGDQLSTVYNGTTNEEVIRVLIDRLQGLDAKFPCSHNKAAIISLVEALASLERRTAERKSRGVEGTHKP